MTKYKISIIIVTLVTLTISGFVTLLQPAEYRSNFSLLIIERSGSLDGYAAAKSAERLSLSLGQIIATASLADTVYTELKDSDQFKDNPLFSSDEQRRRIEWRKHVETRIQPEVGLLKISVYQEKPSQAEAIATTLSNVLLAHANEYLSGGATVLFRVVDQPLTSKRPVRPNIALNLAAGLLLGLGSSIGFGWLRDITKRSRQSMAPAYHYPLPLPQTEPEAAHSPAPDPSWNEPAPTTAPYAAPAPNPLYASADQTYTEQDWRGQYVRWNMPPYQE